MLKNHWRLISFLERAGDNLIIVLAFFLSYHARDPLLQISGYFSIRLPTAFLSLAEIENYFVLLGFSLPLYNSFLTLLGAYRSMRLSSFLSLLRIVGLASGLVFLCLGFLLYFLKLDLSRSFVAIFCVVSGVGLLLERLVILQLLRYFRIRGKNFRNVLIVGTGPAARKVYLEILQQQELGLRVVGFVAVEPEVQLAERRVAHGCDTAGLDRHSHVYDLPARVVATSDTFEAALKKFAVDEVLFTDVVEHFKVVKSLAEIAVEEGVRVTLAADIFSLEIFKSDISYFGSIPLIHYHPSPGGTDSSALIVKRAVDVVVSAVGLVVLSPLLLLTAIAIKCTSPGPIFFTQRRVGLNGRQFVLLKFRSMIVDAEEQLAQLLDRNEMTGPVFKMTHDPRVTTLGRYLRRYSIDELPQLFNVLRGDMSLVGPRPPLPDEVSLYLRKHRKRLSMRPGLTCTWQVSGRNSIPDFERWAELDLEYIDTWSLMNDLKLLIKTIPAVLSGAGAR